MFLVEHLYLLNLLGLGWAEAARGGAAAAPRGGAALTYRVIHDTKLAGYPANFLADIRYPAE